MGFTQTEAAGLYGCSLFSIKLAEYDKPPAEFKYRKVNITLRPYEKCVIWRKRAKKLQREVAEEMGVSRYWINSLESGEDDCTKLLQYWESAG